MENVRETMANLAGSSDEHISVRALEEVMEEFLFMRCEAGCDRRRGRCVPFGARKEREERRVAAELEAWFN